jgi:hypothetical protein
MHTSSSNVGLNKVQATLLVTQREENRWTPIAEELLQRVCHFSHLLPALGQHAPVPVNHLQTVILHRVVGRGDHHANDLQKRNPTTKKCMMKIVRAVLLLSGFLL